MNYEQQTRLAVVVCSKGKPTIEEGFKSFEISNVQLIVLRLIYDCVTYRSHRLFLLGQTMVEDCQA